MQHSEEHAGISGASQRHQYVEDGFGLMTERCYHKETQSLRVCRAHCRTAWRKQVDWLIFLVFFLCYTQEDSNTLGTCSGLRLLCSWWGHFHLAEWIERLFTGAPHLPLQGSKGCAPWLVRQNDHSCCKRAGNHLCKAVQKALNSGTSLMFIGT